MRMAEARARMHLRESVREDDVDLAIGKNCFPVRRMLFTLGFAVG